MIETGFEEEDDDVFMFMPLLLLFPDMLVLNTFELRNNGGL